MRTMRGVQTIAAILTVLGIVTFTLFIFEEATQMVVYGTWAADKAKDFKLQLKGVRVVETLNSQVKWINNGIGWIHPFAFFSYRGWADATDYWIEAQHARLFAQAPEIYAGQKVKVNVTPERIDHLEDGIVILTAGQLTVITKERDLSPPVLVEGTAKMENGRIILKEGG